MILYLYISADFESGSCCRYTHSLQLSGLSLNYDIKPKAHSSLPNVTLLGLPIGCEGSKKPEFNSTTLW